MIPLSQISVYDIQSKAWFPVTAAGDIPGYRIEFCAVVSASVDQSTFQVTIFGGWNSYEHERYEDVFVLTVPSFRWIKVNHKNDFEATTTNEGRSGHRCIIYKDAQMIVLGGTATVDNYGSYCHTAYRPLRVLDTSSYTYRVPDIITNVIGGK